MVYILFYRIGHENNAESFTDVLIPSLVTVFVLLLFTSGLLIILVLYLKKKSSSPRGYKYRDKGNTKYQTYLSGNFTIKSQQNKNSLIEWKKKAVRMILLKVFYFVCSDFKKNSKEVLPFTSVEYENGNVQYDSKK